MLVLVLEHFLIKVLLSTFEALSTFISQFSILAHVAEVFWPYLPHPLQLSDCSASLVKYFGQIGADYLTNIFKNLSLLEATTVLSPIPINFVCLIKLN